jgi:predicted nucleic-acid-binding Zn-ribbon protein
MGLFSQPEPEERVVRGKPLRCLVCTNDRFYKREAMLNTAGATFLNFDWANKSGTCFVCSECGYIHWFLLD